MANQTGTGDEPDDRGSWVRGQLVQIGDRTAHRIANGLVIANLHVALAAWIFGAIAPVTFALAGIFGLVLLLLAARIYGGAGSAPVAITIGDDQPRPPAEPACRTVSLPRTVATAAVMLLVSWMLLDNVGNNPAGLFADEAEIGVFAHTMIAKGLDTFQSFLFYPHFGYAHLGALPVYATAPAVFLLGLSDVSVRLSSVLWSMAALLVLLALVRQVRWRYGGIAVALFACSPVFIHIGRINFGHAPSLFCVSAGLYAYARARAHASYRWAVLCGVALGLSVYGYSAYYIAAPVIVLGLGIGELAVSRTAWRAYRVPGVVALTLAVMWSPVVCRALTNDRFWDRFQEKADTTAPLLSIERLWRALENYPKYFSPNFLFEVGSTGLPGGWNLRHSVPGAGLFPWIALPLVLLGIIAIFRLKNGTGRVVAIAGLVTLILYPLPDIMSTSRLSPPYTFGIFPTLICVPLLAGYGIHWASGWGRGRWAARWSSVILPLVLLVVILGGAFRFITGPYEHYPEVSAGYYGWQFGPRQVIGAFQSDLPGYDRYWLTGEFNAPEVFLDFYLADDPVLREKTAIGGLDQVDLRRDAIFAVRAERLDAFMQAPAPLRRYMRVVEVIDYPDGDPAFYLVEVSPANPRPLPMPW